MCFLTPLPVGYALTMVYTLNSKSILSEILLNSNSNLDGTVFRRSQPSPSIRLQSQIEFRSTGEAFKNEVPKVNIQENVPTFILFEHGPTDEKDDSPISLGGQLIFIMKNHVLFSICY